MPTETGAIHGAEGRWPVEELDERATRAAAWRSCNTGRYRSARWRRCRWRRAHPLRPTRRSACCPGCSIRPRPGALAPPGGNPCRFVVKYLPFRGQVSAVSWSSIQVPAVSWSSIQEAPARTVPDGGLERFLTEVESRRLGQVLAAMESEGRVPVHAVAALRLLMLTGCRCSEIVTLRWEDVHLEANELRLRDSKTRPRAVPLSPAAARVLAGLPRAAANPWVIAGLNPGMRLPPHITYYWYRARERPITADRRSEGPSAPSVRSRRPRCTPRVHPVVTA